MLYLEVLHCRYFADLNECYVNFNLTFNRVYIQAEVKVVDLCSARNFCHL